MFVDEINVEVRDKNLSRKGKIDPEFLDLKAVRRHLKVGDWTIKLPAEHPMSAQLWTPGSGIIISIRDEVYLSGPTNKPKFNASKEDPTGLLTFSGTDDNIILADALAWPVPSQPNISLQTLGHDVRTGNVETLMKAYVDANIGPSAPAARRGLFAQKLQIETNNSRGPSATKEARFPKLIDLLGELGIYGNLGFRVVQIADYLQFQVYSLSDLRAFTQFDIRNDTLEDQSIEFTPPALTRAIVAGQGEQENRQFVQRTTTASTQAESDWGRVIEEFIDQRQTNDVPTLQQAGDTRLIEAGFTSSSVKAVPSDDLTREFILDWDIGDLVTIVLAGQPQDTTITEVSLVANSGGIAVGTAFGDVSGFTDASSVAAVVDSTAKRVSSLERTSEQGLEAWTAYTPTVTAASGTFGSVTVTSRYNKRGRTVTMTGSLTITTVGTAAGGVYLTLPVPALTTAMYVGAGREHQNTGAMLIAWVAAADKVTLYRYDNTSPIAAGNVLKFTVTYEAAA